MTSTRHISLACYHCGDTCRDTVILYDGHNFCCDGCRTVYEILSTSQLCEYYELDQNPGITPKAYHREKWSFLDNEELSKGLLRYRDERLAIVNLNVPGLHCTSCIYLLENLNRLSKGIISSEVNFLRKEVLVKYEPAVISLRGVVESLCMVGYAPSISLAELENNGKRKTNKAILYKIGIAGFCFGNIMILSLPEYFDWADNLTRNFIGLFRTLNVLLILPVIFYSAADYFRSAWSALRLRSINMDLPVAIGLAGLIVQSFYDVLSGTGSGYFDSISAFVFMLLLGRFFQQRTQQALEFDRDFKSYFPLAVTRVKQEAQETVKVTELKKNDVIEIHHEELIPADSILESISAEIDYAFVTGESREVSCHIGEQIYAGGRNKGQKLRLRVLHEVSQSYLTKLWNSQSLEKHKEPAGTVWANRLARVFTVMVIALAAATAVYWQFVNPTITMRAVTSVLIVACPCVLALSIPFTFGSILRIFGRNGLYLKNGQAVEALALIDTIVFDKTGTLTQAGSHELIYEGETLSSAEIQMVSGVAAHSTHPVSRSLRNTFDALDAQVLITNWKETVGEGIEAEVGDTRLKLGKYSFVAGRIGGQTSGTYISIDGNVKGRFEPLYRLRTGLEMLVSTLRDSYRLFVLSGDDERDSLRLRKYFNDEELFFRQKPDDKLNFIIREQARSHKVMMVGDGLNDAAALHQSDFGLTITDDINAFTPAADAILDAHGLEKLPRIAALAKATKVIVFGSVAFSLAYNCIGLSFAIPGHLQPWVAAILMPASSISVLLYTQISTRLMARKYRL